MKKKKSWGKKFFTKQLQKRDFSRLLQDLHKFLVCHAGFTGLSDYYLKWLPLFMLMQAFLQDSLRSWASLSCDAFWWWTPWNLSKQARVCKDSLLCAHHHHFGSFVRIPMQWPSQCIFFLMDFQESKMKITFTLMLTPIKTLLKLLRVFKIRKEAINACFFLGKPFRAVGALLLVGVASKPLFDIKVFQLSTLLSYFCQCLISFMCIIINLALRF